MRANSPEEMEFQAKIQAAFEQHHNTLGFPVMLDVLLGWLLFNLKFFHPSFTKKKLINAVKETWEEVEMLIRKGGQRD